MTRLLTEDEIALIVSDLAAAHNPSDFDFAKSVQIALLNKIQEGGVLVVLIRPEGYEDVHPDLVAEDAIKAGWLCEVISEYMLTTTAIQPNLTPEM